MPLLSAQHEPTREYLSCVKREEELGLLRNQAKIRKPMLVFGPEGVGKSRLLRAFVASQPLALYVAQMRAPREFLLGLLSALHSAAPEIEVPENGGTLTTASFKGIVHRALDTRPFLMVLDHLDAPSRVVTGMIKDLYYYGRTPVIFASRSPHMEDIGALRPLCANKSERLELKELASTDCVGICTARGGEKRVLGFQYGIGLAPACRVERWESGRNSPNVEDGAPATIPGGRPDQGARALSRLLHGPRIAIQHASTG